MTPSSFLSVAQRLQLLDETTVADLEEESLAGGQSTLEIILRRGLLTTTQIDIVETMRRPGEVVPGYEIVDLAGQGGMGVVYRARQLNLDRIVALKTLLVSQIENEALVSRFEQEARMVARLLHPNIVAAHDFGRHEERLYLVMEYIDGTDVGRLIRRNGPLSEAVTWGMIRQSAAALAHAAAHDVVHRDIKPDNLLLVAAPEGSQLPEGLPMVKVADFGLAYLRAGVDGVQSSDRRLVGSPYYMAPEQFQSGTVDHQADLYSLGATAFHMLTGAPPFEGLGIAQLATEKAHGTIPEFPSDCHLSKDSTDLVAALMAPECKDRVQDYQSLIDSIDNMHHRDEMIVLPDLASRAHPNPSTQATELLSDRSRSAMRPSRMRSLSAVVATGVLMGIIAVSLWLWQQRFPAAGARDYVISGRSDFLFDGEDLDPWLRQATGGWTTATDRERAKVLSGNNGSVERMIEVPTESGRVPVDNYKLAFLVQMQESQAAEIQFGFLPRPEQPPSYLKVRITQTDATFGEQKGNIFTPIAEPFPLDPNQLSQLAVLIERNHEGWWVMLNEHELGSVGFRSQKHAPRFRLAVEGGPAYFSDMTVEELIAPRSHVK